MNAKLDPGTATDSEIRQALRERRAGEPGPTLAGATEGDLDLELTRRLLATASRNLTRKPRLHRIFD